MEIKWIDRQYHIHNNAAVEHQDLKMYFNTGQFPSLSFSGPHYKPRGSRGLRKHYHLHLDPKTNLMGRSIIFF